MSQLGLTSEVAAADAGSNVVQRCLAQRLCQLQSRVEVQLFVPADGCRRNSLEIPHLQIVNVFDFVIHLKRKQKLIEQFEIAVI